MKISITHSKTLNIEATSLVLRDIQPMVNGHVLANEYHAEIIRDDKQAITLRYSSPTLGGASFFVEVCYDESSAYHYLHYWIEDLDSSFVLNSFGLRFGAIENLRAYLQNGYNSWDSAFYVEPEGLAEFASYEPMTKAGFAMTQLLPRFGSSNLVLGFDRHDRFQHMFTFNIQECPIDLIVLTLWDQKKRLDHSPCESERLFVIENTGVEDSLQAWARLVADMSILPPRMSTPSITGWSSWYNLYSYISDEIILEHLHDAAKVAERDHLPMRVFEIDDGFTPEMGDWLEVKPQFSRGMKPLLDDIRTAGFIPGLWIAPFMVGNRSRLFREHPDWVLYDLETGKPLVQWKHYGEYRWHKRSEEYYILDTTHPEAFKYLQLVFRTWKQEWGCEYFKTDFMHFGSEHGPDRARFHTPGMTRMEIWRRVAEMIRQEIGDAIWLGCGCPLWASVGLVDGIRIGNDVGIEWKGNLSVQSLLQDMPTRNFANHILWKIDPDSILLRERYHDLAPFEVRSLAIFAGMSGGVMITGDNIQELSNERLRLWKLILGPTHLSCRFPLLGTSPIVYKPNFVYDGTSKIYYKQYTLDPVLVQVRGPESLDLTDQPQAGLFAVFVFNTGENSVQRTYALSSLGLSGSFYVYDWSSDCAWATPVEGISVTLSSHDGKLFFFSPQPIPSAPAILP